MERAEELFEKIKVEGNSAIDEFIFTRKAEELFIDFKRSADNGTGKHFNNNDRKNFHKAISGFGNSEGGIVVWGVDCSQGFDGSDVAKAKCPIENVKRFVSWLEGAISGSTIPPHSGVQNFPLETDDKGNGFVVTYIPKSNNAPHQDVNSRRYYIRAGSDFVPISHDVLAGMFGKRPQPKVRRNFHLYPLKTNRENGNIIVPIGLHFFNDGPGVAVDLFVSLHFLSVPGPNCKISYEIKLPDFKDYSSCDYFLSIISNPDLRLPPGGTLLPIIIEILLVPPFEKKLNIEGMLGFGNAPPLQFSFKNSKENIQSFHDKILGNPGLDSEEETRLIKELLGM
jgi:hypothetical protein